MHCWGPWSARGLRRYRPTAPSSSARTVLAWIFIYYGAGKLFGAFNGGGIHGTALYFSETAHLHPGGLFAVIGGVIEFGGGVAMAIGLGVRLAGLALFGDMVMAMITVTWATGLDSESRLPSEHGARRLGPGHGGVRRWSIQHRRPCRAAPPACRCIPCHLRRPNLVVAIGAPGPYIVELGVASTVDLRKRIRRQLG